MIVENLIESTTKLTHFPKVKIVSLMYDSHLNLYTLATMDILTVSLTINITKEIHP